MSEIVLSNPDTPEAASGRFFDTVSIQHALQCANNLPAITAASDAARAELGGYTAEDWQKYDAAASKMARAKDRTVDTSFMRTHQLLEDAHRKEDATSVIRMIASQAATAILDQIDASTIIGANPYWPQYDEHRHKLLCSTDETGKALVYFGQEELVTAEDSRSANLEDCIRLLRDIDGNQGQPN